jgi:hypothetical protein
MGTSSADPSKLGSYSTDGLALIETLRAKSNAVSEALGGLSGPHVPAVGDVHTALTDLVGDWAHLDEFVGDVGRGFRQADSGGGVVTVSDADILRLGRVGFADRDEAIAAAQAAQRRLDELLRQPPDEIDRAELDALLADIGRGQHDPAFAVTFSNAIGVDGYVDTMTLIQNVYVTTEGEHRVTDQGMAYAAMLGATLTTALRTVDYNNPANANLAPGDRLSYDFVEDLTSGFQGSEHSYNNNVPPENPDDRVFVRFTDAWELNRNLSVLMSFTDPPTWVAVDIANNRLSPQLNDHLMDTGTGPNALVWGDRSGSVTNYATMLSRNSDASTQWLYQNVDGLDDGNIELVLNRHTGHDMDDGRALAQVVENGLTNNNEHESIPGAPSYVQGAPMREALMERAIDTIGGIDEIRNDHVYGALAEGVTHNMNVLDERINGNWDDGGGLDENGLSDDIKNTHDFLREVMGNEDAMRQVSTTLDNYIRDEMLGLPTDPAERQRTLEESGRLLGVFTQAEANAILEAGEGEQAERLRRAGMVDSVIGLVPGYGPVPAPGYINSVSDILFDKSAGDILYPGQGPIDDAQQQRADIFDEARLNTWTYIAIEGIDSGAYDPNQVLAAAGTTPGGEGDFLTGAPGDPHRTVKPIDDMTDAQRQALANWLFPDEADGGPFDYGTQGRRDRNDLSAGLTDTALSELMDRTEN